MNYERETFDYCRNCDCVTELYCYYAAGCVFWKCSRCNMIVDEDYDEYDYDYERG
jgi:hypothetical protein